MRTVNEVSKLAGVSVRTLHHYDAIGLLKPTKVTDAGYRLYDDTALERLQSILLFRELQFPLKEIKVILDSSAFDAGEALAQQIKLLELQYKHIGELISCAREIQTKGVKQMDFQVFDKNEMEQYKEEVKAKWGETEAYHEYARKRDCDYGEIANRLMLLFAEIGTLRDLPPCDGKVQEKIRVLQRFITKNYYNCTNEILSGLGQMYVCDERFKKNIDKAGGEGTAEFVFEAIQKYCS
ncbi:HTH-type transcriptional activator TipA [Clostridiales bacterium]|jgi:DNA-binding transcriptional MerR regulator|nr:MerR family transcriptional regulator [Clostridiales bacterium]GFI56565.1 HTH-type transcriptional activator TipA [Clostridiales bacterium]